MLYSYCVIMCYVILNETLKLCNYTIRICGDKINMIDTIKWKIEELLSKTYFCSSDDLNGESIVFTVNNDEKQSYIKILAYRHCVVVCTSENLHDYVHEILQNKNRDEIFELPFVYGQTIHYIPDGIYTNNVEIPQNYEYEYLEDRDISSLSGLKGFDNSLSFDENGCTSTGAVYIAKYKKEIVGVAGAAKSSVNGVWEIGVDILEEYRKSRLATYLVRKLTEKLLDKNIVPFYSSSVTNIGSQMVASRCDYIPFWVDTYGTILDGSSVYNDIVGELIPK